VQPSVRQVHRHPPSTNPPTNNALLSPTESVPLLHPGIATLLVPCTRLRFWVMGWYGFSEGVQGTGPQKHTGTGLQSIPKHVVQASVSDHCRNHNPHVVMVQHPANDRPLSLQPPQFFHHVPHLAFGLCTRCSLAFDILTFHTHARAHA